MRDVILKCSNLVIPIFVERVQLRFSSVTNVLTMAYTTAHVAH